jgi:hypothetical protein
MITIPVFWLLVVLFAFAAGGFAIGRATGIELIKRVASNSSDRKDWDVLAEDKEYHCTEEAPDFRAEVHDGAQIQQVTSAGVVMQCRFCGISWMEAA